MIKAFLFDFDGTLANTLPLYIKAYDKALSSIGFSLSEQDIVKKCFGIKEVSICRSLGVPEKSDEFTKNYFSEVKILCKEAALFDGTLNFLIYLRERGIKTAIITFAYRWYIDMIIEELKIGSLIDMIVSSNDVKYPKPEPEAVLKICHSFKVNPKDCIVVGDSRSDIIMAHAAGSKSALMHPKNYDLFYSLEELKKTNPDTIIQNITELKAFL